MQSMLHQVDHMQHISVALPCTPGGGGLGFANAGLGFHAAAEDKPADAFDSFREQRSGRYKSSMIKPPPASFS